MNRKLHNTVTALAATTGLLVLSLMAANPAPTADVPFEARVAQARHAEEAAKHIDARAAQLQARLAQTKDTGQALGEIAGFAAEAATLATIAVALDRSEEFGPGNFQAADAATEIAKPRKRALHGRQSVAMPFFSFAPRG